jgi:hypothetical protein
MESSETEVKHKKLLVQEQCYVKKLVILPSVTFHNFTLCFNYYLIMHEVQKRRLFRAENHSVYLKVNVV